MEQRVSVVEGKLPILLIAPNGADDRNTDRIAEIIATRVKGFAVINWGWRRGNPDPKNDRTDCNNVFQLTGVAGDEFLEPIIRFKNRIIKSYPNVLQFVIQGVSGNDFDPNVDVIAGDGEPHRSCEEWFRDILCYIADKEGIKIFMAKPGTSLSGYQKKNMNQLFAQIYPDPRVQSIQLEIVKGLRDTTIDAELFSDFFAKILTQLPAINRNKISYIIPKTFSPRKLY